MKNEDKITKECSIYDCLNLMTEEEVLDEANKWECPNCKKAQICTKKLEIYQTGPILILHLKRNQQLLRSKISKKVGFPIKNLDISQFASKTGESKTKYDLFAVCNHYGTEVHQGHYTAFAFDKGKKDWRCFDDEKVFKVEEKDIVTEHAYILFYEANEIKA